MMKANLYVKIKTSPETDYISVENMFFEDRIEEEYEADRESAKAYGFRSKVETFEGFKLQYILLEVEYDGRKRRVTESDVKASLEKHGLAKKVGESMFGGFYLPTDRLKDMLDNQLKKRKELIAAGKFEVIA